ncbi:ATP-binding protein [Maritalea porphyrae]|uniref:Helicase HerA central domain-containing protein n=1 Tax=Maritalea porphyrae TaxID=880732 RepID=A0ABQ5UMA5_9HYPH|nr:DUF87 domain-containing protein [Maritalea porphyrae]GLQ15970.1 hypothetical protein GCM10007879_02190 [Maritalea porphyrae]
MSIQIGEVIAVMGVEVSLRAYENSNLETHFYNGRRYKGVSIREFISIEHGFREIICIVEGEYLDERKAEQVGAQVRYERKLKARPIGFFENAKFYDGIKFLPKIGDPAKLLSEEQVNRIFERKANSDFVIGKLMKEEIAVSLPWQKLFNSHLGVFGNTGSGKSNTLAKLFTVLFDKKIDEIAQHSQFIFLDFNGEYTGEQIVQSNRKCVLRLKTRTNDGDKFLLPEEEFWDVETLGILFQATANTQRPFLRRVISEREKFRDYPESLNNYVRSIFERVLMSESPNPEALELLKSLSKNLELCKDLVVAIHNVGYNNRNPGFFYKTQHDSHYFSTGKNTYNDYFSELVEAIDVGEVGGFKELQCRAELKLISDILYGFAQYDHINPLLRRIEALKNDFSKVLAVGIETTNSKAITVISLRDCNQDVKKILPIFLAKHFYNSHKERVSNSSPPNSTMHLVIDEAHNILSQQSTREMESWKDYRLELFEEIIKEGRKFGVFITLASQRPADISATIVSQLHNYFIHRLVNDRDLALLENTISTLDSVSRSQIPMLPQGGCVVTGTSFDIPMLIQVDKLDGDKEPDSSDVNLEKLWS